MITDTHCHLFWKDYDADREEVIRRARTAGVERLVIVGTDVCTSELAFELARSAPSLFPTAGIHPHDAAQGGTAERTAIRRLCESPECVAVGETGLDFFKEYSPRAAQIDAFRWHLELARELDKPVIVHCRDAHEETMRCIEEAEGVRGVMHCYTMGTEELPPYLAAGFLISFSGVVTYPKNEANRAAARAVPAERLLVETDCPFLAPQGYRGQRNEPAYLTKIVQALSLERGEEPGELARRTSANAELLFGLDRPA